jgi:cell division protein FtsI/penicillin-binding protein 2
MRTAVFIGLTLVVAAAAGFLAIMYAGPSPLAAAEQYLEQIASRDFAGIEQYFAEDKPHPTSAELEEGFRRFAQAFGLEEIERTQLEAQSEAWRAAEYTYKLRYTSRFFEPLEVGSTLRLSRSGLFAWKVEWGDDLPLPEYGLDAAYRREREQPARGYIYDRNGDVLAGQGSVVAIGVQPNRISDPPRLHQALQEQLGLDPTYVQSQYEAPGVQGHWFVPLATVSEEEYARVDPILRPIPGIFFRREESRAYPLGTAAGHLTGYIGEVTANMIERFPEREYTTGEVVGRSGLEGAFDDVLRGRPGLKLYVEPSGGEAVLLAERPLVHGKDIYLTIDGGYQATAAAVLGDYAGAIVVLDANTGEVLAAASAPSYDPTEFVMGISAQRWADLSNDPLQPLFNRAFQGLYPPGSIFKVLTAAAALDQGVHTVASQFNDSGELRVEGNIVRNFEQQAFGLHVFPDAVIQSINTTMAQVGLDLGAPLLQEYFSRWKLNTGWDLGLSVREGQIGDPARSRVALAWSAIGQDRVLLTPLHVAQLFTVFAGDGLVPEIVLQPRGEGEEPQLYEVLTPDTAGEMRTILARVVQEGTGTAAQVSGIDLIGKTGTAETSGTTHAWFGGLAFDVAGRDLAFAILVEGGGIGGRIAAPLARELFSRLSGQ